MVAVTVQPCREIYYTNNTYKVVGKASLTDMLQLRLSKLSEGFLDALDKMIPGQEIAPPSHHTKSSWSGKGYRVK